VQILPQAICTRYGLTVGATLAPFVRVLLLVFYPVSYPISKVCLWGATCKSLQAVSEELNDMVWM